MKNYLATIFRGIGSFGFMFLGIALAMLCSGCIFTQEPYREIAYYDFGIPQAYAPGLIEVVLVENTTPLRQRLLFRKANGQIEIDEYHRLIQPPDELLTRYLANAFPLAERDAACRVELKILLMEADLAQDLAHCVFDYKITGRNTAASSKYGTLTFSAPLASRSPEGAVNAWSDCMHQLGDALAKLAAEQQ